VLDEQPVFIKVTARDVEVGKPLRWSLYDGNRQLLLKRGNIIENQRQCDILVDKGLYRNARGREIDGLRTIIPPRQDEEKASTGTQQTSTTLEKSRIRIGDAIQLQGSPDSPRYYVKLIGYLKNKGLIVTAPETDGQLVMLRDDQSFVARFFSGKNAYAFSTSVVKQTNVPFTHLHLSYPREVAGVEIRKGSRIDVDLIAAISIGENQAPAAGKIMNLSTGGAAIRSKTALGNKGDVFNMKFRLDVHGIDSYLTFESVIRSREYDPADSAMPYSYGIQFIDGDKAMALALAAFVYKQLADDAKS